MLRSTCFEYKLHALDVIQVIIFVTILVVFETSAHLYLTALRSSSLSSLDCLSVRVVLYCTTVGWCARHLQAALSWVTHSSPPCSRDSRTLYSRYTSPHLALHRLALPCYALHCRALLWLTSPCLAMPYLTLPSLLSLLPSSPSLFT